MTKLLEALPVLVVSVEAALVQIGRGDVADQLREVELERWTYDDFADAAYLYLRSPRSPAIADGRAAAARPGETVSPLDDVNLSLDEHKLLASIEVLGARDIVAQLQGVADG